MPDMAVLGGDVRGEWMLLTLWMLWVLWVLWTLRRRSGGCWVYIAAVVVAVEKEVVVTGSGGIDVRRWWCAGRCVECLGRSRSTGVYVERSRVEQSE